jgi:cytosine/adenosine deaminase-related metal-dependent hydrolase
MDASMIIRSKYLIDDAGRVVENAYLRICGDRIAEISSGKPVSAQLENTFDLGDHSVLLPGLINAHAHLELTLLRDRIQPRLDFTDWIRNVIRVSRGWDREYFSRSLREGIRQSVEAGTTAVGDIHRHADCRIYSDYPLRARVFFEVIDFNPATADATADHLQEKIGDPIYRLGKIAEKMRRALPG